MWSARAVSWDDTQESDDRTKWMDHVTDNSELDLDQAVADGSFWALDESLDWAQESDLEADLE